MPNWCGNRLYICGPSKQIEEFKNKAKDKSKNTDLSFAKFVIEPQDVADGQGDWHGWRCENWGTKWDVEASLEDWQDDSLDYQMDTAWSPPIAWLAKVAEQYPELEFMLKYEEVGMCFMGVAKAKDGKLIMDDCINY